MTQIEIKIKTDEEVRENAIARALEDAFDNDWLGDFPELEKLVDEKHPDDIPGMMRDTEGIDEWMKIATEQKQIDRWLRWAEENNELLKGIEARRNA